MYPFSESSVEIDLYFQCQTVQMLRQIEFLQLISRVTEMRDVGERSVSVSK